MARNRMIKPEFWEDEKIGALSPNAKLLFIACLNFADDEGLIRWNPFYLAASAFIYDNEAQKNIEQYMEELIKQEIVYVYNTADKKTIIGWIINFHKHQRIDKPQPSKFQPPNLQNPGVKSIYAKRDKMICYICGTEMNYENHNFCGSKRVSIDHIIPKSKGGSDYPSNIRAVHISCNKSKGTKDLSDNEKINKFRKNSTMLNRFGRDKIVNTIEPFQESVSEQLLEEVATKEKLNEVNIKEDKIKEIKTSRVVFLKPTKSEIIDYINQEQLKVDCETFFDYYESNGWKVGKVPMKDWKATLRNWDRKTKEVKKPFKNEFLEELQKGQSI